MIENSFDYNIWRIDFGLIGETLFNLLMTSEAITLWSDQQAAAQQTKRHASLVFGYNSKMKISMFILLFAA